MEEEHARHHRPRNKTHVVYRSGMDQISTIVEENEIPITLVGLPQSDMYMMGKTMQRPHRTTLNIPKLAKDHGIRAAMAINNVQNTFTPQGSLDPLSLCPLAVALSQSCTIRDCAALLVSRQSGDLFPSADVNNRER